MTSEPDHEHIAMMIKYGITREQKYVYYYGRYRYDSFDHALAEAMRKEREAKTR